MMSLLENYSTLLLGLVVGAALSWGFLRNLYDRSKLKKGYEYMQRLDARKIREVLGEAQLPAWLQFPDHERVQWIDDILLQLWPYVDLAVGEEVRRQAEPLLAEQKPAWIQVCAAFMKQADERPWTGPLSARAGLAPRHLFTGNHPAQDHRGKGERTGAFFAGATTADRFQGPPFQQVYNPAARGNVQEVLVDFDFQWAGDQDIKLAVKPIPKFLTVGRRARGTA